MALLFSLFFWSQVVMMAICVGLMLPLIIWHEWRKGNDLTYEQFFKLLILFSAMGATGLGLVLLALIVWKFPPDSVELLGQYQPNSIYEPVGSQTLMLPGSRSAKTMRALLSSSEDS
jgi:hypothetical protein